MVGPRSADRRAFGVEAGARPPAPAGVGPTVMPAPGVRKGSPRAAQAAPRQPPAIAPTAIPGVQRERIAVALSDLGKLAPLARPPVLQRALQLVQGFVPQRSGARQAVMWGHRQQQEHSELVSRTLELSRSDLLDRAGRHIARMSEILSSIDLEAVCGTAAAPGVLKQYLRKANRRIDTPAEFGSARIELDQLLRLLSEALEQLLSFKDTLERHSSRIDQTGDELEAWALAAQFLSSHLMPTQPTDAQRFLERSMSLTQTVIQIRSSTAMREVQVEHPLRLIGAIQDVALVMVPGWLGSIAALNTLRDGQRALTPTEAGEMAHQLRNILRQLNPTRQIA